MAVSNERLFQWISETCSTEFDRAKKLISNKKDSIDLKNDETVYKAAEILENLLEEFNTMISEDNSNYRCQLVMLFLHYNLVSIYDKINYSSAVERHVRSCIEVIRTKLGIYFLVDDYNSNDELTNIINGESNIPSSVNNKNRHKPIQCEQLFQMDPKVWSLTEVEAFQKQPPSENDYTLMEQDHIYTLYYFAQVYQNLGNSSDSANYCHSTLRLQYKYLQGDKVDHEFPYVDHIDWALNSAKLSQYFSANEDYDTARHLMCCARKVLLDSHIKYQTLHEERWKKAGADLDRIEVKYCLTILIESNKLMQNDKLKLNPYAEYQFKAYLLDDPQIAEDELELPKFPVKNNHMARSTVKYALDKIESAKKIYTINDQASQYAECIFDNSAIYDAAILFEEEKTICCKMNKRRIDMFEGLLSELNPQYFQSICRKIHFEIGEIYIRQISLKRTTHEWEVKVVPDDKDKAEKVLSEMRKQNQLVTQAFNHLYRFISSFEAFNSPIKNFALNVHHPLPPLKEIELLKMPSRIKLTDESEEEFYLEQIFNAYVALAGIFRQEVTTSANVLVRNWYKSKKYCIELRDYLLRNPDQKDKYFSVYHDQFEQLLKMVEMLPMAIESLICNET
ncbi:hypothetical protein BLOT_011807 [Blomia tropicalis]|nr:hypothetical protein BLOT_011807 [Blomia tropicalis]